MTHPTSAAQSATACHKANTTNSSWSMKKWIKWFKISTISPSACKNNLNRLWALQNSRNHWPKFCPVTSTRKLTMAWSRVSILLVRRLMYKRVPSSFPKCPMLPVSFPGSTLTPSLQLGSTNSPSNLWSFPLLLTVDCWCWRSMMLILIPTPTLRVYIV